MKTKLLLLSLLLSVSQAATISVSNSQGFATNQIADASGALLNGATVSFGYFSGVTDTQLSGMTTEAELTTYTSSFQSFASTTTRSVSIGTLATLNGFFDASDNSTDLTDTAAFGGRSLYILITNGSSEAFIYKFDTPLASSEPTTTGYTLGSDSGSILFGSVGAARATAFGNTPNSFNLASVTPIPEPSSALLAGLGGLVFLVRRKRA